MNDFQYQQVGESSGGVFFIYVKWENMCYILFVI